MNTALAERVNRIKRVVKSAPHDQKVEVAAIFAEDNMQQLDAFLDGTPWTFEKTIADAEKALSINRPVIIYRILLMTYEPSNRTLGMALWSDYLKAELMDPGPSRDLYTEYVLADLENVLCIF